MPNVEIYGVQDSETDFSGSEVRAGVIHTAEALGIADEVVITTIRCLTMTCDFKKAPFLRVYDSNPERLKDLAKALHEALPELDIEMIQLDGFIPSI